MTFVLSLAIAAASCSGGGGDSTPAKGVTSPTTPTPTTPAVVASVTVTAASTTVVVDQTTQCTATPKDSTGAAISGKTATWSSSDTTIATVSATGTIKGVLPGTANITAAVDGKQGARAITVTAPKNTTATTSLGLTGYFNGFAPDGQRQIYGWGYSYYGAIYPENPDTTFMALGAGTWVNPNWYENASGATDPGPTGNMCGGGILFQSIEGGIGTWGNLPFPSNGPNESIVATSNCYQGGVGGPTHTPLGAGLLPDNYIYFAQLSNRLLAPPGALTFVPPTEPQLLGHGWVALPLIPANKSPYGFTTGQNSWTLLLNASNFQGPLGFFTPAFWTDINRVTAVSNGYGLDARTGIYSAVDLEVGYTTGMKAVDSTGTEYRRVPRVTFGVDQNNRTTLVQDFVSYGKSALYTPVGAWVNGGVAVTQVNTANVQRPVLSAQGEGLHFNDGSANMALGVTSAAFTTAGGGSAWGLQWSDPTTAGTLPQYYKKTAGGWVAIPATQVPRRTWLTDQVFTKNTKLTVVAANTGATSAYSSANWAAGPFTATLNNGSSVDYVWYKFVDQPAIARLGLTASEKATLQAWVESLHGQGLNALTMPPPSSGKLATFDAGLFVTPPAALARGYVPIVIAQR